MGRARQLEVVYLDTHILMWLYDGLVEKISPLAQEYLTIGHLHLSPMAELELQYLHEIGRVKPTAQKVVHALQIDLGLKRGDLLFGDVVRHAITLEWTRDPFDRLIVAEASSANARLITRDETIRKHYPLATW